ncbi:MAG: hypothetical protein A2104_03090 [Candidatus Melainabacteria bacterium GWF2_32_7]|nr:MAG: hypothetical protein A2104_03090 [Candidatus Melainabacteria bacterium GWF2_32_7]
MSINLKRKGNYEAFETTHHHKILVLDNSDYYAWIDTAQGHLLVKSDSDHKKEKTLNQGDYILITPHNEPDMKDAIDHLELKEDGKYHTYILPNGLPTNEDEQKKIVHTDEYLNQEKINNIKS